MILARPSRRINQEDGGFYIYYQPNLCLSGLGQMARYQEVTELSTGVNLIFFSAFYSKTALALAQLSYSLDPPTNSKTMNPNFHEYFD